MATVAARAGFPARRRSADRQAAQGAGARGSTRAQAEGGVNRRARAAGASGAAAAEEAYDHGTGAGAGEGRRAAMLTSAASTIGACVAAAGLPLSVPREAVAGIPDVGEILPSSEKVRFFFPCRAGAWPSGPELPPDRSSGHQEDWMHTHRRVGATPRD